MGDILKPDTADQVVEAVRWAAAEEVPLEVVAGASKRALGRPVQAEHTLDLSGLSGITLYEPEELVLSALPGTPLPEIGEALAKHRQMLAFEPSDLGPVLGGRAGGGTLGGTIAANLAGPRRIKAGAARDHVLGLSAASGRGEMFKTGGRVVKNVTGYDLCKLMTGSFGTLGAITALTVKVLPAPETQLTLAVIGLDDATAIRVLTDALSSPYEVSGAAHMPIGIAGQSAVSSVRDAGGSVTAIRLEGFGPSVDYRAARLSRTFGATGRVVTVAAEESDALWREIRDVRPFVGGDRMVWKISAPPGSCAGIAGRLVADLDAEAFFDWGGGLIWLGCRPGNDGAAETIRRLLSESGGHATLVRAAEPVRTAVPVFQPQARPLADLTRRIKDSFDPRRVLNPGRMYAGV